jgi:DNA-binding FadR family transcriptional regulator
MSDERLHLSRAASAAAMLAELAAAAPPGSRLGSKDDLRVRCGVSVGTFNEAVRLVQARGLVAMRPGPGGGLFATQQSPIVRLGNSVLDLDGRPTAEGEADRIADALEPLLIDDALWHASPADIAEMRSCLDDMAAATASGEWRGYTQAHWRLHRYIASVSPNEMLRSLGTNLFDLIESATVRHTVGRPDLSERYELHRALVDAIDARDRDAAMGALAMHAVRSDPRTATPA